MNFPGNVKYTNTHEWIRVEGEIGWIGITDYAQSELGDVVFVELPAVGAKIRSTPASSAIRESRSISRG